jgi:hypothetical protein
MPRSLAWFFSIIGHPMLVLVLMLWLMLSTNPYMFGVSHWTNRMGMILLIQVFVCTAFLPGVGALLMRGLGFVKSLQMDTTQERIGPYILTGVFYLWLVKNLWSVGGAVPRLFLVFVLGATLSLFVCFFINIFTKISAHAAGMGGMVVMLLLMAFCWEGAGFAANLGAFRMNWALLLALGVLLAGAVGTSRLVLQAHTPADLYRGYVAGAVSVVLAWVFLM